MNMFDLTHAFVPGHFIRHYLVNYYILLINAKKTQKQCRTLEESCFESDLAGCHDKTM